MIPKGFYRITQEELDLENREVDGFGDPWASLDEKEAYSIWEEVNRGNISAQDGIAFCSSEEVVRELGELAQHKLDLKRWGFPEGLTEASREA